MSSRVPQLPPTASIKDSDTRMFCDAMVNAWQLRNGDIGHTQDERFITKKEFDEISKNPTLRLLMGSPGVPSVGNVPTPGVVPGPNPATEWLTQILRTPIELIVKPNLDYLWESIRNSQTNLDKLWVGLDGLGAEVRTTITSVSSGDYALAKVVNKIWAVIGADTGSIIEDGTMASATPTVATATKWLAMDTRIFNAESAHTSEITLRSTQTQALAKVVNRLWAVIGNNTGSIIESGTELTTTASIAEAALWTALTTRVGNSEGGLLLETNTRVTDTTALAKAINTIWSAVGNNLALIQDGSLTNVGQYSASASKWTQVQSAVFDGNGVSRVAVIRQDFNTYVSTTDGVLNAAYTLRINAGNCITGFGLAVSGGTSSFVVDANQFWISPTGSAGNKTAPFFVDGSNTYISSAFIRNASIDMAKIVFEISSSNYVWNIAGWAINKAGDAQFNNVRARGDIQATSLTADIVYTQHIAGAQLTRVGSASGSGSATVTIGGLSYGYNSVIAIASAAPYTLTLGGDSGNVEMPSTVYLTGDAGGSSSSGTVMGSSGAGTGNVSVTATSYNGVAVRLAVFVGLR